MICRVCDSSELVPALELGPQPWANNFLTKDEIGSEPRYPLQLVYCTKCCTAQLNYTVPKEVMFANHTYVSGTTKTLAQHFLDTAQTVSATFFPNQHGLTMLDIGSNDGTQLLAYQSLGYEVLGIESCDRIAQMGNARGTPTVTDFFCERTVEELGRTFDVINASGVFFHLEELHSATRGVKRALKEDGVFVVQFLYMKSIVENVAFDQIYHEHLLYYTVSTIQKLLRRHDLEGFDGYLSPIHGGSIVLFVTHRHKRQPSERLRKLLAEEEKSRCNDLETYLAFAERVARMREDTLHYLERARHAGKKVYGFGAPVKGNTFLNYCGIGTQYLEYLVEKNPMRRGLYSPGMHIPILLEQELRDQPDIYLVLAWNFRSEILANNKHLLEQGIEFYFPVVPKSGYI